MQTRLLSLAEVARATKRSHPYIRALADSGVVDSYVTSTGWRAFGRQAIDQVRAHDIKKAAAVADG
jgi:hypothetical protein